MLNRCSCLALKSSKSICFSSSILRVWVYNIFFPFTFAVLLEIVALVRCIIISIIFSEMFYSVFNFFFLSIDFFLFAYFSRSLGNGFLYFDYIFFFVRFVFWLR